MNDANRKPLKGALLPGIVAVMLTAIGAWMITTDSGRASADALPQSDAQPQTDARPRADAARTAVQSKTAPQLTSRAASTWINSDPLSIESFRGKVLLMDVWTFDCWNCYRSFPWLKDLEARLAPRGLAVLGIHSPEFDHERDRQRVIAKVREFGITHPVMLDNDFAYWKALGNRYWPAFYIVDRKGAIRGRFVGETHAGDKRAREIEGLIESLLAE